jgi:hypothetical protein
MSDIANEITESLARNGAGGMTGPMKAIDGTAAAPSITFGSETSTGLYRVASGQLGITTGGVQRFNISSSGSTFSVPVTVNGNLTVSGTISGNGSSITSINASNVSSGTIADARLSSNVPLKNALNTFTGEITVDAGSNSGIAVKAYTTAQVRFECTGATTNNKNWIAYADSGSWRIVTYTDSYSSGASAMVIARSGTTPGNISTYGNLRVGELQGGAVGRFHATVGDATHTGYVEFINTSGGREGYIGYSSTTGGNDTGTIPYVAGTHAFTGNITVTGTISGNGSGLTSLNASNISTGTLADARLSSNVPLKNAWNTFTGEITVDAGPNTGYRVKSVGTAQVRFECTGATTDNKNWIIFVDTNSLQIRPYTDDYASSTNALSIARSGVTAGDIKTYSNLLVGANNSGIGYTAVNTGDATHSGYTSFYSQSGTRVGYIGWATVFGTGDNGTLPYVAGTHAFTGTINTSSQEISSGTGQAQDKWFKLHTQNRDVRLLLSQSTSDVKLYDQTGSFARWTSDVSGNFTASGTVSGSSDARLKADVKTIEGALDKVSAMRGVSFRRTDTGQRGVGVIAQEVAEVVPEVVHEGANGYLSVAYGNMVGVLIEAVKELRDEVLQLKAKYCH